MSKKPDPLIGRTIASKYLIEEKIGQGGMGSVYRTRHLVTGKVLAIKVLLEDLSAYDSFVQRFLHEARAAAFLTNPHIINIVDCGREGDVVYLLMEFLHGHTLHQLIKNEGPFSPGRAARILGQICSALADAHAHAIIHRDLKPENVMLRQVEGERDYVKVLDFGIAKVLDEQGKVKLPASRNLFIGTPEYASPEQCNSKPPTPLSDIYGLGVILFEMLTGRPPFLGEPMQVMMQHTSQPPPTLGEMGIETSSEIESVVARALEKDPQLRFQSALQLAAEFQAAAQKQRRQSREIPGSVRPSAESYAPARSKEEPDTARRSPLPGLRGQSTPVPRTAGKLRIAVLGVVTIFVLAGILSAGYIGYQFVSWYGADTKLPSPPGPPQPPSMLAMADPLVSVRLLLDQGNRDGAIQELRKLLEGPIGDDPATRTLLGTVLRDQGDLEGAAEQFQHALERSNRHFPEAHYQLGLLKRDLGDEAGALDTLQTASGESGHQAAAVALARLYLDRGDRTGADRMLAPILSQPPDDPHSMLLLGEALGLRNALDSALRETRRAIALQGDPFPEGHYQLGMLLLQNGDAHDAVTSLSRAIEQRGGNYPNARFGLGLALAQAQNVPAAAGELRAAIRLRGGNFPPAELALAQVLAQPAMGAFDEADRLLETAIRHRGGKYPEAREAQGTLAFFRYGRLEEARKAWQEADTETARELSRSTADAFPLQAGSEEVGSSVGDEPPPENSTLSFNFALWPAATGDAWLRFGVGENALLLEIRNSPGARPKVTATRVSMGERQPVDAPLLSDLFPVTGGAKFTLRIAPSGLVFSINDRDLCRFPGRPVDPLRVSLRDARAVLYKFQTGRSEVR